MKIGPSLDPALEAASLALTGREEQQSSRFASIELRGRKASLSRYAPLGYVLSALAGMAVVILLWTL